MTDPHISQKISRFPVPEFSQLPEDIQQMLTDVSDKAGFIPNVFLTLAYRPDELRAFFAYHNALMLRKGGISKAEKEMILLQLLLKIAVFTVLLPMVRFCVSMQNQAPYQTKSQPIIAKQILLSGNARC